MKALHRTLAILACLFLVAQTVRHAYELWLDREDSVLDAFDQPLKDDIAAAASVEELLRRYEPVRKEVDRIKAERRATDPKGEFQHDLEAEPFKSEAALRHAIGNWEGRAKEIHALRYYWSVGLALAAIGLALYRRGNRWYGTTCVIIAFSEMIYWTTPEFFGGGVQEFDRLVANKLVLSAVSMGLLGMAIRSLRVFEESTNSGS
jgi:hypothetical protein